MSGWGPRQKEVRKQRRLAMRFLADTSKCRPCDDCGGRFPTMVMDYDHRDHTEKQYNVSSLARFQTTSWRKQFNEIGKCDLVCSNCHRVRTFNRKQEAQ